MTFLARTDQTVLGRWWWTVDWWSLLSILALALAGVFLVQAASPAVAIKHGLGNFYFVERHAAMLVPALAIMLASSLMTPRQIRLFSLAGIVVFAPLLAATPFLGSEIKGATRWLALFGLSIQPSEFVKPFFIVTAAWLFSRHCEKKPFPALGANLALYAAITLCLVGQPDIGMTALVSLIWLGQFFLAGMPLMVAAVLPVVGLVGLLGAYTFFPHFASRLDRFISHSGDTYQTDKAIEAIAHGGLLGVGPGAGTVKMSIPDAHADFIFAVAGEELGLIGAGLIVVVFAFVIMRGFWRLKDENNLFVLLAGCGLLAQFGLQMAINLGSTLRLIPAKGMTLPFISYGGSSLWASAIGMGMLLALTRKRFGIADL